MTAETGAKWVLRFISFTTLPAFCAVVMPQKWLAFGLDWIEPGAAPGLFGSYLIRCLMGVYAFMGIQAFMWSTDVRRYRPLILSLCWCAVIVLPVALGVLLITVSPAEHVRAFWVMFIDLAEGLAHIALLTILMRHVTHTETM